jgi:hypothetical protein
MPPPARSFLDALSMEPPPDPEGPLAAPSVAATAACALAAQASAVAATIAYALGPPPSALGAPGGGGLTTPPSDLGDPAGSALGLAAVADGLAALEVEAHTEPCPML